MTKLKTSWVKGPCDAALVGQIDRYDAGVLGCDYEGLVDAHRLVLPQDDVVAESRELSWFESRASW